MSERGGIRGYLADVWEAWDTFWFAPTDPSTLSAIRVFAGAMLFYTHLVWSFDLTGFFGQQGWLPTELTHRVHELSNSSPDAPSFRAIWSYFDYINRRPSYGSSTSRLWSCFSA